MEYTNSTLSIFLFVIFLYSLRYFKAPKEEKIITGIQVTITLVVWLSAALLMKSWMAKGEPIIAVSFMVFGCCVIGITGSKRAVRVFERFLNKKG